MSRKVALITGASSGIGRDIAQTLFHHDYIVYACARRLDCMQDLKLLGIKLLSLDITSEQNIKSVVDEIVQNEGHIDVLINNAGVGLYGSLEEMSIEQAKQQFEVNVFGLVCLTQAVIPVMRSYSQGTIINISSVTGKVSMPFMGWYAASKHAVEAISDSLRIELEPFGIHVVVIEPGRVQSEFASAAFSSVLNPSEDSPYFKQRKAFGIFSQKHVFPAAKPDVISKTVMKILNSNSPKTRYAPTIDSKIALFVRKFFSDKMLDFFIRRQLK